MWNTRYFVVPVVSQRLARPDARLSRVSSLQSESIYPEKGRFDGPNGKEESKKWMETQDFRVLRNKQEFPRSWVVHKARAIKPVEGLSRETRAEGMREILYAAGPILE